MNDEALLPFEVVRLARAIRFTLVAFIVGISYFNIRTSLSIDAFEQMFKDMLGGKPLPYITEIVLRSRLVLIVCSWLVPAVSIGVMTTRKLVLSFYILGILALVAVAQMVLMSQGITEPFFTIIRSMQGS